MVMRACPFLFTNRTTKIRLGVLVAVNSGMMINVVWRIVKSLLDERTRNKINFLKGTKELLRLGIFDPNTLPVQYGGTHNSVQVASMI